MYIGKQLGRYEIRSKIGAGGMGEVYLARDLELERDVALKILPSELLPDETRKNRFRQEARAASALNHPNLLTIYEISENEHGSFLATELIEGETLRDVIKRESLSITANLKIIEQIAKALAAAHRAHIVHRDIKPENIMIRADGIVKVLDFGLAKPTVQKIEEEDDSVKTIPGVVLGSSRYMSPEQARGLPVDERTDIWSLGVVLYEMLTGIAPFKGETTSDTIAAVIYKEPAPINNFVRNAPPELGRIIRKALQKDREERYQSVQDFALDVKDLLYEIEHTTSGERRVSNRIENDFSENATMIHQTDSADHARMIHLTDSANHSTKAHSISSGGTHSFEKTGTQSYEKSVEKRKLKFVLASFAAIVLMSVLAFGFYQWFGAKPHPTAAAFDKNQVSRLNSDGKVNLPAISPSGKYIAYVSGEVGSRSLVVRQISTDSTITVVPATNLEFRSIAFSPADDYIYYTQMREDFLINTLYRVPTLGGSPKKLIEDVDSVVTFSPDGKRFAFVRHVMKNSQDQIFIADAENPNPQMLLTSRDAGFDFFSMHPAWSPDGAKLLIGAGKKQNGFVSETKVVEISTADKTLSIVPTSEFYFVDNVCWFKDGSGFLFVAQETRDAPFQIYRFNSATAETKAITNDFNNYTELGLSVDGETIVTIKGDTVSSLWRFTPSTRENTQLTQDTRNLEGTYGLAQMPDGRLLYSKRDGTKVNFQTADADGKNPRVITTDLGLIYNPVPTLDGRYIVFSSQFSKTPRIWRADADGKNPVQLTEESADYGDFGPQILADGKTIVFLRQRINEDNAELMKIPIGGGAVASFYSNEKTNIMQPRVSPDGKFIAFSEYDIATYDKQVVVASIEGDSFGKIENTLKFNLINSLAWSPDSRSLTIASVQDGVPNIFKLPLDGSAPQPITAYKSGKILNFAWSRDGKNLFLVRGITNNDLILIRDSSASRDKEIARR